MSTIPTPPRRRWFRFRLRTLLVAVALLAIPMAWVAKERRQSNYELRVAEQLRELGFELVSCFGPYDEIELLKPDKRQTWWRRLATRILGERLYLVYRPPKDFMDLTRLAQLKHVRWMQLSRTSVTDFAPLSGLTSLKSLSLDFTSISNVEPLAGLTKLEGLYLDQTRITDVGPLSELTQLKSLGLRRTQVRDLKPLVGLENLDFLYLDYSQVSDLSPLTGLKNLKKLYVSGVPVTKGQVETLQRALPDCEIEHNSSP